MRLEDYFVFLSPEAIHIKGTTVAIEHVLYGYLYGNDSPEEIAARFPALRVEHVYAAITFYWHRQEAVEAYVAQWVEREKAAAEQQDESAQVISAVRQVNSVQAA